MEIVSNLLPSNEIATNFGFCLHLILSASAILTFCASSFYSSQNVSRSFSPFRIWINTLACGMQINTGNIVKRLEHTVCSQKQANKLGMSSSDPLELLIIQVFPLGDVLLNSSTARGGMRLSDAFRKKNLQAAQNKQMLWQKKLSNGFHFVLFP